MFSEFFSPLHKTAKALYAPSAPRLDDVVRFVVGICALVNRCAVLMFEAFLCCLALTV